MKISILGKKISLVGLLILTVIGGNVYSDGDLFNGYKARDPYPLHNILSYKYIGDTSGRPLTTASKIIKALDIENNTRYFKVGVLYKNKKAYEIPLTEIEDFNLNPQHTNTYCNIFVIDVLTIMANTLGDESYRITKTPINANSLRKSFEDSIYWHEVSKKDAVGWAQYGEIVIVSYVENPHGHVAFVKPNSTEDTVWLWNVGAVNSNNLKWNKTGNVKYFRKVS